MFIVFHNNHLMEDTSLATKIELSEKENMLKQRFLAQKPNNAPQSQNDNNMKKTIKPS